MVSIIKLHPKEQRKNKREILKYAKQEEHSFTEYESSHQNTQGEARGAV